MSANIEYQLRELAGGIDNASPRLSTGGDVARNGGGGYLGAVKHTAKSLAGLALLVSLGVIGVPFLVYFVVVGAITIARTAGFA